MQRPIELFALLDYIKQVIKYQRYHYLANEPFETIFISYSSEPVISALHKDLLNNNFVESLSQIHSYEQGHSQLHQVYMSIKKEFISKGYNRSPEDFMILLKHKYGILEGEELAALLDLQTTLIEEHEFN